MNGKRKESEYEKRERVKEMSVGKIKESGQEKGERKEKGEWGSNVSWKRKESG